MYLLPKQYRHFFIKYTAQFRYGFSKDSCFLKNYNNRSKKRVQNLGRDRILKWVKFMTIRRGYKVRKKFKTHTFCKTVTTLLTNTRVDMININRMGRWKSEDCVERYTENLTYLKKRRMLVFLGEYKGKKLKKDNHTSHCRTCQHSAAELDPTTFTFTTAHFPNQGAHTTLVAARTVLHMQLIMRTHNGVHPQHHTGSNIMASSS